MRHQHLADQIAQIAEKMISGFSRTESLLEQLDSVQVITLVAEVEKSLGVQLPAIELSRENLVSIESLAQLVEKYQS